MEQRRRARIGFHFVAFPESIWDDDIHLTLGEFRLFGYIIRHTLVYGEDRVRLTDDELINGRKRADGTRKDRGCGIRGPNNLTEAKDRLQGKGWLIIEMEYTARPQPIRYYSVNPDLFSREDHPSETEGSGTLPGLDHPSETEVSNVTVIPPKRRVIPPKRRDEYSETEGCINVCARGTEPSNRTVQQQHQQPRTRAPRSAEEIGLDAERVYAQYSMQIGTYLGTLPTRGQREEILRQFEFHIAARRTLNSATIEAAITAALAYCEREKYHRPTVGAFTTALGDVLNPTPRGPASAGPAGQETAPHDAPTSRTRARRAPGPAESWAERERQLERDYQERFGSG